MRSEVMNETNETEHEGHERYSYSPAEREKMLAEMTAASDAFYAAAVKVRFHQFVELTGFMNEIIKVCARMHKEGKDFGTEPLEPKDYEMEYICEKFDCIFGRALEDEKIRRVVLAAFS
jgi:hypothetical protein